MKEGIPLPSSSLVHLRARPIATDNCGCCKQSRTGTFKRSALPANCVLIPEDRSGEVSRFMKASTLPHLWQCVGTCTPDDGCLLVERRLESMLMLSATRNSSLCVRKLHPHPNFHNAADIHALLCAKSLSTSACTTLQKYR